MDLICSGDGDIPLWMKMGDGNESEQKQFSQAIKEFKKTLKFEGVMVADAALYTQENLQYLGNIKWISRVPLTIKSAKNLVTHMDAEDLSQGDSEGYSYREVKQIYGTIEQRWLVVESEKRREANLKSLEKKIKNDFSKAQEELKKLRWQSFACALRMLLRQLISC